MKIFNNIVIFLAAIVSIWYLLVKILMPRITNKRNNNNQLQPIAIKIDKELDKINNDKRYR